MSQNISIREFFNSHPPAGRENRRDALTLRKDYGRLLGVANRVFGAPVCTMAVVDHAPARTAMAFPAIRIGFPNGADLTFYDTLRQVSIAVNSPERDVPARLMRGAVLPDTDWDTLYRPGFPLSMAHPAHRTNPRLFTFKTYERNLADLQLIVTQFAWLQKQAMGLTRTDRRPGAVPPAAAAQTAAGQRVPEMA